MASKYDRSQLSESVEKPPPWSTFSPRAVPLHSNPERPQPSPLQAFKTMAPPSAKSIFDERTDQEMAAKQMRYPTMTRNEQKEQDNWLQQNLFDTKAKENALPKWFRLGENCPTKGRTRAQDSRKNTIWISMPWWQAHCDL